MLVWRCHNLLSGFLTNSNLPWVSSQSRLLDNGWSWGETTVIVLNRILCPKWCRWDRTAHDMYIYEKEGGRNDRIDPFLRVLNTYFKPTLKTWIVIILANHWTLALIFKKKNSCLDQPGFLFYVLLDYSAKRERQVTISLLYGLLYTYGISNNCHHSSRWRRIWRFLTWTIRLIFQFKFSVYTLPPINIYGEKFLPETG